MLITRHFLLDVIVLVVNAILTMVFHFSYSHEMELCDMLTVVARKLGGYESEDGFKQSFAFESKFCGIPYTPHGAKITPHPLFFIFVLFLCLF